MFRVAFTVPLTARRATTTLAEGKSRRRSGQRRLLAGLWYLTGVISKRRTCGSSGFSGASERVRWNTKPAASRRRSRRRCTAGGMIPVANFLASCAGAGSTSHSRRRYPSLHSGMLSSSSALRRWCHRYVECSQARCRFNMFGGQLVLNGFKNNLMTDGSPFPSWSGCGRGLHKDRVGLMRPMATRQRHLVSPRAALAAASQSQHVPCTTKRASAITKPLATHVTRSSTCLFSS